MVERRFVGLPVTPTSVLLLTEEPPATVEEKVDRFGINEERVFVISRRKIGAGYSWPKTIAAAVAFCRAHPEVGICVVDTWDKFAGLSSSKSETDTGTIVEMIEPLYELLGLGVCVALITHQRKQEGEYGLRVRGGTAFTGSADIIVEVERPPESAGLSKDARVLKLVSRFAGAPDEIAVELGPDGWRPLGTVKTASRRSKRDELLSVFGDEPLLLDQILVVSGLSRTTAQRRLNDLVEHRLADRLGGGKRHDPYRWRITENGRFILLNHENRLGRNSGGHDGDSADRAENTGSSFSPPTPPPWGEGGRAETCGQHPDAGAWLARDSAWRCRECDPPTVPGEIVGEHP
jgi:hypothetical protein